jgi:hypothetical protein
LHHIHPLTPFPHILLLPLVPTSLSPGRTCFALLFSNFVEEKEEVGGGGGGEGEEEEEMTFLFVKMLWQFHVYMY